MKKSELKKLIRETIKNTLNEAAVHCTCRHTSGSPTRSLVCRDGSGIDNCEDCCDTKNFPGLPKDWESVDGKVRGTTGDEPMEDEPTNQMMNEQGAPYSKRRRVHGCKCDEVMSSNIEAGLGIVVTQAEIDAYSAQHPPMQDPFGGGLTPAIFHHYGSGYIAYRDVGGGKKLICPRNMYYEFQHATVDCDVPQERQVFWQDQAGHPTVKIALNGVMQEIGGGQVQSFQSATCGGSGVFPHPCLGTGPGDGELGDDLATKAPDSPVIDPMDKIEPMDMEPSDREPMDDAGIQRMRDLAFRGKR